MTQNPREVIYDSQGEFLTLTQNSLRHFCKHHNWLGYNPFLHWSTKNFSGLPQTQKIIRKTELRHNFQLIPSTYSEPHMGLGAPFSSILPSFAHFLNKLQTQTLSSLSSGVMAGNHDSPPIFSTSPLRVPKERELSLTQHCPLNTIFPSLLSLAKMRSVPTYNTKPLENDTSLPLTSELSTITSVNLLSKNFDMLGVIS